jgi:tetratricopeptide (TPR) repeat protein
MPSHIYLRTGDFDDAVKSNDLAIVADRNYIPKSGAQGIYPAMYYNHNIHMLAASYARNGNFAGASKAASELETNVLPMLKAMPMLEMFAPYRLYVLTRFKKWDDIMKYPQPAPELKITTANWHMARGMALAESGKPAEAEKELSAMREVVKTISPDAMLFTNPAVNVLKVADGLLAGEIALARGDKTAGIESLRQAAAAEDLTHYAEPPDWDIPVREWLGRALMRSGDYAGAEKVYREELDRNPRSGRALFGLAEALRKQGNILSAQMVEREFENTWRSADTKMSPQDLYGTVAEKTVSTSPLK